MISLLDGITTHSTRAEIASFSFARSDAWLDSSRRVNSGVMPLRIKTEVELNEMEQKVYRNS
jgi:hypothetical protein